MNLKRVLRLSILCEVTCGLAWGVAAFLLRDSLPPELRSFMDQQWKRQGTIASWLGGSSFVVLVVGWIGLWRLWWRARAIYTVGWLLGIVGTLFRGPRVYPGPPGAAALLSTLAGGLILGIVYFSDLRQHFGRPRMEQPIGAA
jgi:hypothetical protein